MAHRMNWNRARHEGMARRQGTHDAQSDAYDAADRAIAALEARRKMTQRSIEQAMTPRGGYSKKTLEAWGVPWPPPKDWKNTLIKYGIPYKVPSNGK